MGCGLRSRVSGQPIQPKPGNQVSNDRRRQRRMTTDDVVAHCGLHWSVLIPLDRSCRLLLLAQAAVPAPVATIDVIPGCDLGRLPRIHMPWEARPAVIRSVQARLF
jgi:hypothetical protein